MKLNYSAPQAEIVEISLNDSVAAGCAVLIKYLYHDHVGGIWVDDHRTNSGYQSAFSQAQIDEMWNDMKNGHMGDADLDAFVNTTESWNEARQCFQS